MDVGALATFFIGTQTADFQLAVAAKLLRMNAQAASSVNQILEAAEQNAANAAQAVAGLGENLDISA